MPVSPAMLQELRAWWKTHRHPTFLFPGPTTGWRDKASLEPMRFARSAGGAGTACHLSVSAVQNTFRLARAASGLPAAAPVSAKSKKPQTAERN